MDFRFQSQSPLLRSLQILAGQTLAGGCAGLAFGCATAFVKGQPMAFMGAAYGSNAMLFTGAYLGMRQLCLGFLSRSPIRNYRSLPLVSSFVSGAIVGGAFTAGRHRVLAGGLLWACVGGCGQAAVNSFDAWRTAGAAELLERRRLWSALSPAQRAAFRGAHSLEDSTSAAALAPRSGKVVQTRDFNQHWAGGDASDPPAAAHRVALQRFAAACGVGASEAPPTGSLTAATSAPRATVSARFVPLRDDEPPPSQPAAPAKPTAAAAAAVPRADRPWYSWLPVRAGASADEMRLERMEARLRAVSERLAVDDKRAGEEAAAAAAAAAPAGGGEGGGASAPGQQPAAPVK